MNFMCLVSAISDVQQRCYKMCLILSNWVKGQQTSTHLLTQLPDALGISQGWLKIPSSNKTRRWKIPQFVLVIFPAINLHSAGLDFVASLSGTPCWNKLAVQPIPIHW